MPDISREQIAQWLAEAEADDWGPSMSTDDQCAVLRLALRTLDAEAQLAAMTERAERAEKAERDLADCAASVAHVGESPVMDGGLAENVPASVGLALQRMKARAERAERERDVYKACHGTAMDDNVIRANEYIELRAKLAEVERERDARPEISRKDAKAHHLYSVGSHDQPWAETVAGFERVGAALRTFATRTENKNTP